MRKSLLLLCLTLAAFASDTDGDGRPDWSGPGLLDQDNDGCFDRDVAAAPTRRQDSDSLCLVRLWDSSTILNNQWDACCGFFDDDSSLDILGTHWNPNQLHIFEHDGATGFDHVWTQSESMPPGSYSAVCSGDPDEDGDIELIAGEVSTLGKVFIWENTGDNTWGEPHLLDLTRLRARVVRVADTDGDSVPEIVLLAGSTDGGKVFIYEHAGAPGEPSYVKRWEYSTVSYIFNGSVGDADNDGRDEVLIGVGGWHGFPMYIRRLVYNPVADTYEHHMFESSVIGLHISPMACDIDSSGDNELVVGSSGDPSGQVQVFRYAGNDSFTPLGSSQIAAEGNVIAVNQAWLADRREPVVFAAPFAGVLYGLAWQNSTLRTVGFTNPGTGSPIRSVDWSRTGNDVDLVVLAESGPSNFVSAWRPEPDQGLSGDLGRPGIGLGLGPSPTRGPVRIASLEPVLGVSVFDRSGRRLASAGPARSFDLRQLAPGISAGAYLVEVSTRSGRESGVVLLVD